jgi:D-sedoheptulose 7-phosphate isomerase
MKAYIQEEFDRTAQTLERLAASVAIAAELEKIANACCAALRAGRKIIFAGNGGSAAEAQHLAGELIGRFKFDRPGLAALALTTDASSLTAIGNDYGYECVFARQLDALGVAGDVFFALSTSGTSPNVLRGLEAGRRKGLVTVGLTGDAGGAMLPLCDYCIRIPSLDTPQIQEGHLVAGHIVCGLIERNLFGAD